MKKIFRKNQIIIAALAVMIAAAGYLNYSGRLFGEEDTAAQTSGDLASQELLDISEEDVSASSGDIESQDADAEATGTEEGADDGSVDGTPGEAVLTSGDASAVVAEAKVTREQVRAKNKEDLLSIIDNQNLSDEQKQDAVNQMVQMTDLAEKEAAAETLLASKGFDEAVVSLTADSADVVVNASELSDANRKTGIAAQNIVITPINTAE